MARFVREPGQYRWSCAKAHLTVQEVGLVKVRTLLERYGDWRKVLSKDGGKEKPLQLLGRDEWTGPVRG